MPAKKIDLTGMAFGKLTVLEYSHSNRYAYWRCRCECGKETTVRSSHLLLGAVKTCGCSWIENGKKTVIHAQNANKKHGYSGTRLYHIWSNMIQRCKNKKNIGFNNYGGRGIKVYSEWKVFEVFKDWAITNGYTDNLTIDRINVNGNYEPLNCRWVDMGIQANNRRDNVYILYKNVTKTTAQWAREYGIPITTFNRWLDNGDVFEDIINKKCGKYRGKQHLCEICRESFLSYSHKSRYCSDDCKRIGENKKQQIRRMQNRGLA
jgi:hypothetical protein